MCQLLKISIKQINVSSYTISMDYLRPLKKKNGSGVNRDNFFFKCFCLSLICTQNWVFGVQNIPKHP